MFFNFISYVCFYYSIWILKSLTLFETNCARLDVLYNSTFNASITITKTITTKIMNLTVNEYEVIYEWKELLINVFYFYSKSSSDSVDSPYGCGESNAIYFDNYNKICSKSTTHHPILKSKIKFKSYHLYWTLVSFRKYKSTFFN